jgi:caffeoyl-CoA O-methyltransferase
MNDQTEFTVPDKSADILRPVTPLGIAAKELAQLADIAGDGNIARAELARRLHAVSAMIGGLDPYVEAVTTPESDALAALTQRTQMEPWSRHFETGALDVALEAEMLSGHVEGQFLKLLVRAMDARRVLEIGLFTGYSALAMAEALPADGVLIALELDHFVAQFARDGFSAEAGAKIEVRVGPAQDGLADLANEAPFDFIFIDADKGGYGGYFDAILDNGLLAKNGLIGVDNTLLQGQPYMLDHANENGLAIAEFNRKIADDPRVEQVLVPLRDGVTLIRLI